MAGTRPAIEVPCPRCKRPTASLKQYFQFQWFVFLYVFVWARRATYTACPGCMRVITLQRFAANLIPANLAMFIIGPVFLVQFFRTFVSGHSKAIQSTIDEALRKEERRPRAEANARAFLAALPAAAARLDRREYDAALAEMRAAAARLERIGDWESGLDLVLGAIDGWNFDGARSYLGLLPPELRGPLQAILERFARRAPEEAVPGLTAALSHPDKSARTRAAIALGRIGPRAAAALPALRQAAQDPEKDVRLMAEDAVKRVGGK